MLRLTLSWTAVTQFSLLDTQQLLPMQLRLWGIDTTASWNAAVALAALLSAADFGLRGFGHASLQCALDDDAFGRYLLCTLRVTPD